MNLRSIALAIVASVAIGCGPPTKAVVGIVVEVDQASLTDIRSFTIRTSSGEVLTFFVGQLDLSAGSFPPNHLREHMATASPVAVAYTEVEGDRVAVRLVDAP